MEIPFKIILAAAHRPADLSEAELVARHPSLAAGFAALFLLGLASDVWLLRWLLRRQRSRDPILKLPAKPWGVPELLLMASLIAAVFFLTALTTPLALPISLASQITLQLLLLASLGVFLHRRGVNWRTAFGLDALAPHRALALGVTFFWASLPPLSLVFLASNTICRLLGIDTSLQYAAELIVTTDSPLTLALVLSIALVIAPLFEEVFFRGFAYPVLKQRWGATRAVVLVSAAFAGIHFYVPGLAPLFVLALGFTLAYEWTGSLIAPLTMHILFNATNLILLLYARTQP